MKSILVADNRTDLLATIEPILKHWGYRVLSTSKADQVMPFLEGSQPCMLIIGTGLIDDPKLKLNDKTKKQIKTGALPCIALKQEGSAANDLVPGVPLEVPLEIFELFSFIQRQVEQHPRHNLRLRLKLPGMYSIEDEEFILADVITLSTQGLFFKAATKVRKGDHVNVVFPLFGQGKEIEVKSTVLYIIQPVIENNYFQGFGVVFDEMTEQQREHLQLYIKDHFLREVSASNSGVGDFTKGQLKE